MFCRGALHLGKGPPAQESGCWPGEGAVVILGTFEHPGLVSSVGNPGPESGTEFLPHGPPHPSPQGGGGRGVAGSALALCYFFSVSRFPC